MFEMGAVLLILFIGICFWGAFIVVRILWSNKSDVYNFNRDHEEATYKPPYKTGDTNTEATFIGISSNKKKVLISNLAKHIFIAGTTGSGKTIAISNFIKSGVSYNYPMLLIDGKGDTDSGSILAILKELCPSRKIYIINLNEPEKSDKYNPFQNTSVDVIKDMIINMTNWTEPHYKYNTERFIGRLCRLLELAEIPLSLSSIVNYLPISNFNKLSTDLNKQGLITKEEHIVDIDLSKTSGSIAEGAASRFATIKESNLGTIFHSSGIDIYSALKENAIILFILNPLLYPEMSPLIGNLIIIDSKKAVSNLYREKKERIFYIFDEINVYANRSMLDLVNKSRSANVTCILATQSLADLDEVTPQFKEQVIENTNNYIIMRQNSSVNAEYWANVIGTRATMSATYQVKGENGEVNSTDLGSLRKTREYLYHPDEIKQLKTGEAIFLSRDEMLHTRVNINKPF